MKRLFTIFAAAAILICSLGSCSDKNTGANSGSSSVPGDVNFSDSDLPQPQIEEVEVKATHTAESSIVFDVTTSAVFNALAAERTPSNAILHLDKELNIVADDGLCVPFDAALAMCDDIIPVFYVSNEKVAKLLSEKLNERKVTDCIVMSKDSALVKLVRTACPEIGGAIDARKQSFKSKDDLVPLRNECNSNNAKILLLDSDVTVEDVQYAQRLLMTVWIDTASTETVAQCDAFTSGANGVVTTGYDTVFTAIDAFEKNTLFRKVNIIGHRGQPITNVDNTLSGAKAAYESGADAVECDIYMTKDYQLAIMHDSETSYYTYGKGNVENLRMDEVQFYLMKSDKSEHIPSMSDYFNEFYMKDMVHFIEIKSSKPDAVYVLRDLIAKYGVSHQVNIISFNLEQLKLARSVMPEVSCGYLGTVSGNFKSIAATLNTYGLSYHPNTAAMTPGNAYELNNRGISVNTWTYSSEEALFTELANGYSSVTTDGACWASSIVNSIEPNKKYSLKVGEAAKFEATAVMQKGTAKVECEPIVLGGDKITFAASGDGYTPISAGKAVIMLKYTQKLPNDKVTYKYSKSFEISVAK